MVTMILNTLTFIINSYIWIHYSRDEWTRSPLTITLAIFCPIMVVVCIVVIILIGMGVIE